MAHDLPPALQDLNGEDLVPRIDDEGWGFSISVGLGPPGDRFGFLFRDGCSITRVEETSKRFWRTGMLQSCKLGNG